MAGFGARMAPARLELPPAPQESRAVTVRITTGRVLRVSRAANEVLLAICYDGDDGMMTRGLRAVHVPLAKLEDVRAALRQVANGKAPKKAKGLPRNARAAAKRYFTGKPCPRGHVAARLVSTSACVVCTRENTANWRGKNRERYRANRRAYRAARD